MIGYTCEAHNFQTSLDDRVVTKIKGEHRYKRTNDDVTQILIFKQSCPYLPLNISSFFKNIENYQVKESRLGHLLKGDFDGFTKLKVVDISHNPIEEIKGDVFDNESVIESVSFYNCHLKIIDPTVLNPLKMLKKANFQVNPCISQKFDFGDSSNEFQAIEKLDSLKTNFYEKCQNYSHNKKVLHPHDERKSEEFSVGEASEICKAGESLSVIQKNAVMIVSVLLLTLFATIGGLVYLIVDNKRKFYDQTYRYSRKNQELEDVADKLEF